MFESIKPCSKRVRHSPEELIVPLLPYAPGGHQKNIHEQGLPPTNFTFMQDGNSVAIMRPCQTDLVPTTLAKGAGEDHMIHGLLNTLATEDAVKVVTDIVVPSFKHIASVESIKE